MLITHSSFKQQSFFDTLLQRALEQNHLLFKVNDILDQIPELLTPFIARYEKDRNERKVDTTFGKPTIALESFVRLILLKYLHKDATYRDVEERTKTDYAWKAFAKLHLTDSVPDYSTLSKWETFFGEDTIKTLHRKIISHLTTRKVIKGTVMRTDTTVVPANIHYPTDASLLYDAVRVITKTVKNIINKTNIPLTFHSRVKQVRKILFTLTNALKKRKGQTRKALHRLTNQLILITRHTVARAHRVLREARTSISRTVRNTFVSKFSLATRIIEQTEQVMKGIHPTNRIVSFFQPSMRPIVKGKLSIPCEFGKKLQINETEHGIITDWTLYEGNPPDSTLLIPALTSHKRQFGHSPPRVSTDRGFWSPNNENALKRSGILQASIPKRGYKSKERLDYEHERWFRKLQRWRAGGEAKISWLKRSFGLARSKAKRENGYDKAIGWAIVGCNLKVAASLI